MANQFDALDALCAVSIEVNRIQNLEGRADAACFDDGGDAEMLGSKTSFVCKLLEMITQGETEALDLDGCGSLRWGREGKTVIISDPSCFAQTMLPKYFKHR